MKRISVELFSSVKHSGKVEKNQKDERQEHLLADLNTLLLPIEERLTSEMREPKLPVIFIIGPPRSSTTLMYQLLAHWGGFGYISNFLAKFWLAPSFGTMIEKALEVRRASVEAGYSSEFGRTKGWSEPHEFGYFWNRWFDLGQETHKLTNEELQKVDVTRLKQSIAAIEASYGQPIVFSNNTFCTFQVEFLAKIFLKSLFVSCERVPLFVAQSILTGRQQLLGDKECWWSVRPKEYPILKKLPWWDQIAGQVYYTIQDMEKGLSKIPQNRYVRVNYQSLCANPAEVAKQVVEAVNRLGANVPEVGNAHEHFTPTDFQRISDEDFQKLREGIKQYFESDKG